VLGAGQPREIAPDHTDENVCPQRLDRRRQRMHDDRRHMVEVRVADEDVVDPGQLIESDVQ